MCLEKTAQVLRTENFWHPSKQLSEIKGSSSEYQNIIYFQKYEILYRSNLTSRVNGTINVVLCPLKN